MERYTLREVQVRLSIGVDYIHHCIQEEWVRPANPEHLEFDAEDVARLALINELRSHLGVNDDALPLVLHLIDQLNSLQRKIQGKKGSES